MATETETKKVNPKIDFMPHWKKQDQCFDEEEIEMVDTKNGHRIMKNGKPVVKTWPHDKPTAQISYENWLEKVVNPDTNEYYQALDKAGSPIKGTGPKHIVSQIIRLRRKDGTEYLYSLGELQAYDAFGNVVPCTCAVSLRKEHNINKNIELFLKPFDYLFNADYITPQQKAELRQMAVDEGIIAPSTPVVPTTTAPPKGTYG